MKGKPLIALVAFLAVSTSVAAQTPETADAELAPLARMIGGSWYLGEDSYHSFEWGIGGRSIVSASYWVLPAGPQRVSEMTFLYHPGKETVVGQGVAIEMGVDFFGYELEFRGDTIALDLEAYGEMAGDPHQRETWVFTDDDHYEWTLYAQNTEGEWVERFSGSYERRR